MSGILRVLSYNIHKGFDSGNRRFVLQNIRSAIRAVNADVLFLQEVLGEHTMHAESINEWPTQPQFEYLADQTWSHYAYGQNAVYSEGHHGNAILSRFPFVAWENLDISTNRFERRGILHGTIWVPDLPKRLHLLCVHLDLLERGRKKQIEKLASRIHQAIPAEDPLIVAGDFNDWRERITDRLFHELGMDEAFMTLRGEHARTFPSWKPVLRLDRLYYRGVQPLTARALFGDPWGNLSDHAAVYVELQL